MILVVHCKNIQRTIITEGLRILEFSQIHKNRSLSSFSIFSNRDIHHTQQVAEEEAGRTAAEAEAGRIVAAEEEADRTVACAGVEAVHTVASAPEAEAGRTVAPVVEADRTVASAEVEVVHTVASAAEAEAGRTVAAAEVGADCTHLPFWIVPDSSHFGFDRRCCRHRVLLSAVEPRELVGFPRERV